MRQLSRVFVFLACCLFSSCSESPTKAVSTQLNEPPAVVYSVKGILRGVDRDARSVVVEHEEIPGYMPAMTMPFDVKEMAEVQAVRIGDGVKFQLHVSDKSSWIDSIEKIDANEVKLPPRRSAIVANSSDVPQLKEGDSLLNFRLTDQSGREISRETFAGKPLFITFIFTRCPLPNFCPLMSQNFAEIQKALGNSPQRTDVLYLSITIDPAFDTPEVLANYAKRYSADGERWRFATGAPEQIKRLTRAFSVYVQPEQGTITHGLATILIDANGVIRKIFRENKWRPSEAVEALSAL